MAIGPAIDKGFYYDLIVNLLYPGRFQAIEAEMQKIVKADYPIIERNSVRRGSSFI